MDDILIASKDDLTHHCEIVDTILDTLSRESYFLWLSKCVFEQKHIEYLGVVVNGNTISIDPIQASSLRDWPRDLTTVKQVRSTLGILGYQCPFIPNYANIAKPLTTLTQKNHPFLWTLECCQALDTLINTVLSNPTRPFFL